MADKINGTGDGGKPSYMTSTFSAITMIVIVCYVGLCVWLKDIVNLKELALMVMSAYTYKKATETKNGGTKPEVKP